MLTTATKETLQDPVIQRQSHLPIAIAATKVSLLEDEPFYHLQKISFAPDGSRFLLIDVSRLVSLYFSPNDILNYSHFAHLRICKPSTRIMVGECVRDVDWFPLMDSNNPATCAFITCCKDHPVHLWDGNDGSYRCSYCAYNHCDELVSPHSIRFSTFGDSIFCGFHRRLCVFDTQRPGRDFIEYSLTSYRGQGPSLRGIVSSIDSKIEEPYYLTLGSFSGVVGLGDYRVDQANFLHTTMRAHNGGITMVRFVPGSSTLLLAGARKDDDIVVWDIRNTNKVVYRLSRKSETNQRIGFDIDHTGKFVCSGSTDGIIRLWSLQNGRLFMSWNASRWSISSVSWNPCFPLLASCSGQRCFPVRSHSCLGSKQGSDSSSESIESEWFSSNRQMKQEDDHFVYRNKVAALWYFQSL
ncbi:transducin family protein / WD-40 repeat family protein [Galdieria sulphuraria]|uniref:Transducin family protein / WD-40 repeat family protein n=1 Tax=Galdieria sulphuraria TaxID=130081 RepID=M2W2T2_GALSU|nr:transducin family protein / WD-40 repeat family protein [Galdieria sulphuraria]EME30006.1 transducin family protein / WD-40 repeat family protein [Galdieria sulphuraria]|eukprot:XP_005706526.1 transducin family protein / WD-40 repeat family protein [Galdieria sulphuraria]